MALLFIYAASCGDSGDKPPSRKRPSSLVLDAVHWKAVAESDDLLSEEGFEAAARRAFKSVHIKDLTVKKARLRGELEAQDTLGALALELSIETAELPFPLVSTLAARGKVSQATQGETFVEKGLSDLVSATREMIKTAEGRPEDWIRSLHSAEPDIQVLGARLLGFHRVNAALEPLSRLLTDPREAVAEASADALVRIGDRRAVPLLINSIRRGDIRSEVRVIEAIGQLGGPEAEAYLEMTAIGHELKEVQNISKGLLERLRKEKKQP